MTREGTPIKKLVALFIIMLGLFVIVTACSNDAGSNSDPASSDADSADNSDDSGEADESDETEDRPTITLFTNEHPTWPADEDFIVWDIMEDGGNMNIELTIGSEPYEESLNLVIASGDLPDLFRMPNYQLGNQYGSEGALINYLDHIDDMPNLQKWMEMYPEETRAALSHDGKMYVAPNEGLGESDRMLWLYRQDVFDELGLETPDNWDELHTVLTALKEAYPDSYPLGFRNGTGKINNFAPNFGTAGDYYYDFDKEEWRYGPIEDNYLVLVEYLHQFYEEGLIPPDFLSIDTATWQEYMSTDTSFITQDYIGRIDSFNEANRDGNPDYTLVNMAPPAGFPGGERLDHSAHVVQPGYSVASTSENIDTLIQYVDWTFSEEGRDALSWGIEGETYEVVDGEKQWIPDFTSPSDMRSQTGLSIFGTRSWFDYDAHMALFSEEVKQAYEDDPQYDAPVVPTPPFTEEEQEIIAIQGEEILKHRDQEIAKFIIGDRDLSEWDDYVEEIKTLGVQDLIDLYTEAYNRVLEVELN